LKPRFVSTLIALVIITALTASGGCSAEEVADIAPDTIPAQISANAEDDRGLITIYQPPG
jgi:hydroxymethylpyrimidine/phosphomethylpyrimidine kinase